MIRKFFQFGLQGEGEFHAEYLSHRFFLNLKKINDADLLPEGFNFEYGYFVFNKFRGLLLCHSPNQDLDGSKQVSSFSKDDWILFASITAKSKRNAQKVEDELLNNLEVAPFKFEDLSNLLDAAT